MNNVVSLNSHRPETIVLEAGQHIHLAVYGEVHANDDEQVDNAADELHSTGCAPVVNININN